MGAVSASAASEVLDLVVGTSRLQVCPGIGGSIARFSWHGLDILRAATPSAICEARVRGMASYPLVPYSNRIENARLPFEGSTFALRANFPPEPHAIHGVGWQRAWNVTRLNGQQVELGLVHDPDDDWPFRFEARQTLALGEGWVTASLALKNSDSRAMPAGLGFHPFFPVSPDVQLEATWDGAWGMDSDNLPTEWEALPADADFRQTRPIGDWIVDRCFTGWARVARLRYRDRAVVVTASAALDRMVCLVPGGGRGFMALEPVSLVNNAFALAARGVPGTGIRVLAPGEQMQASMTIAAGPCQ